MRISKVFFTCLVFLFLYAPIAVLVVNSFNKSKYGHKWTGFSWKWYEKLLNNDALLNAFYNSLTVAVLAATAAVIVGSFMAIAIYRYQFKLKKVTSSALFIVMMSPDIVLAITFLTLFVALGAHLGFWTILLAHTTFCLPFVVITLFAQLRGLDPNIIEAARDLGASESAIVVKIILPLISSAIAGAWLLSFTLSLDDVIISSFVTGPEFEVLPIRVFSMVKVGVSPEVNVLATILLLFSIIALISFSLLTKRKPS
jgi:spermidine/putrescine transport system permease protein